MKMIALMAVMAIVTYIIRALPITLFRKEIKSKDKKQLKKKRKVNTLNKKTK